MLSAQMAIQTKLNEAYADAKLRNPSYSLRAFSRKLGIGPSSVSEILSGKRKISKQMAEKILEKLDLLPDEFNSIIVLFEQDNDSKTSIQQKLKSLELEMDIYKMISEWHHFAILSLAETKDFKSNVEWIAARLNLKLNDSKLAIERLERIGLIFRDKKGNIKISGASYTTSDEISNSALRRAHTENLELAKKSLEQDAISIRDFTSITMAIDLKKLPIAKKMIREFRDKISQYLESGKKSEVYKMCIQLIPLSEIGEK